MPLLRLLCFVDVRDNRLASASINSVSIAFFLLAGGRSGGEPAHPTPINAIAPVAMLRRCVFFRCNSFLNAS